MLSKTDLMTCEQHNKLLGSNDLDFGKTDLLESNERASPGKRFDKSICVYNGFQEFVYDSKKAGAVTVSHLRFGPEPIRSTYLISKANFVACQQPVFLERYAMLKQIVPSGTFLLNSPFGAEEVWPALPRSNIRLKKPTAKRAKRLCA